MRRALTIGVLVLAIGSGAVASILTYRILKRASLTAVTEEQAPITIRPLVVATTRLPYGTVLQPEHVRTIDWASEVRPEGSFTDRDAVVGRAILNPVVPEEPILESRLAPTEAGGGLASVIPKGKRAVSVRVNEIIGVAGFVLPKTRVDVLMSVNPGGNKKRSSSRIILQNVEVLAAGQRIERDETGEPETVNVITLLVTPIEAERLTLASNEGDIQLALRNSLDLDSVETLGVSLSSLLASSRRTSKASTWRPTSTKVDTTVEIIRADKRSTERF